MGEFQEKRILYEEVDSQELVSEVDSSSTLIDELAEGLANEKKKKKKKKGHREKKGCGEKRQETRTEVGKLLKMIAKLNSDSKERIRKLEKKTKEMIELVSNLYQRWRCAFWDKLADFEGFRSLTWFLYSKHVFPHQQLLA